MILERLPYINQKSKQYIKTMLTSLINITETTDYLCIKHVNIRFLMFYK